MAEMIGGILGAGASLAGAALSAQAQQTANIINWMNLQFQKRNADKQFRLSTAARSDAYGNKQSYDDLLDEWKLALTPTQEKLTKAGEAEQLRSVTEDAARNRAIRVQQRERGIEAGKDYNRVLAQWRYGGPKSELSIRDELTDLLAGVERDKQRSKNTEMVTAAMREGRGADAAAIRKATSDAAGGTLASNMLQAKTQAAQEYAARSKMHSESTLPVLAELQKLMDLGGDMPVKFSDTPDKLAALQQQQFTGMQQALTAGGSAIGGAFKNLAESSGKSPDFSGIAKALSGIGGKGGGKQQQQQQYGDEYDQPAYSVMQNNYAPVDDDRWTNSYNADFD